jgi:hypothetical protein
VTLRISAVKGHFNAETQRHAETAEARSDTQSHAGAQVNKHRTKLDFVAGNLWSGLGLRSLVLHLGSWFDKTDNQDEAPKTQNPSFAETIQRAASPDVNVTIRDRGRRETFVVQFVHGHDFPLALRFDNGHLSALSDEEDFVVCGNWR